MSCPLEQEVMLLDSDSAAENAAELEQHAARCARCGEVLETLRAARSLASHYAPRPSAAASARMWRNIQSPRRSFDLRWMFLPAAAAAAAILVIALRPEQTPSLPLGAWVRADDKTSADLGIAQVAIDRGSIVHVVEHHKRDLDLRLYRGEVVATVSKLGRGDSFEINTRQARIKVIGTRFAVTASEEQTSVSVEEGKVWVWASGAEQPIVLSAGQKHEIRPKKQAPRPIVKEAPPPSPEPAPPAVVTPPPAPQLEDVEALLRQADVERQNGRAAIAAEHYRRVAEHPAGRGYAEEALLHRARLLAQMGKADQALAALRRAESLAPSGALAPERHMLEADLHEKAGDRSAAIAALERGIDRARTRGDSSMARVLSDRLEKLKEER